MTKSITNERLEVLSKTLKPVVRKNGKLFYIEVVDPCTSSFIWDPKIKCEAEHLVEYTRVPFFSHSYPALWKPSVEEVLVEVQDDDKIIRDCVAFEVVHYRMDDIEGKGNYGTAIFYKLEFSKEEKTDNLFTYNDSNSTVNYISLLVTYIEKETLDIYKIAMNVNSNSILGRNYNNYQDDNVKVIFPKPNNDKEFKIVDVEVINNIFIIN